MTVEESTKILDTIDTLIYELIQLREVVKSMEVPFEPPYTVTK